MQVKAAYQYIKFELDKVDFKKDIATVKIKNKYDFINLEGFDLTYEVVKDGHIVASKTRALANINPNQTLVLDLKLPKAKLNKAKEQGTETHLNLYVSYRNDQTFCKAGHRIAIKQFNLTERAPGPCSNIISMKKSSIALYRYSSTDELKRWISSIKSMSPSCKEVRSPARSPGFSIAGPLDDLTLQPRSLPMIYANVVLPNPGGPDSKIWSSGSFLSFAASTNSSNCSLILS
jgi:hypothetical protein